MTEATTTTRVHTIDETVDAATSGVTGYREARQPIADLKAALNEREDGIKADLRAFAEGKGLASSDVDDLFIAVGLEHPVPVAAEDEADEDELTGIRSALSALLDRVNNALNGR